MIDLHSHILPKIDDGSKNMEMSLKIAKIYVENGFEKVIATPHWIEYGGTTKKKENKERLEELRESLKDAGIELEIFLGNEFFITPNLIKYIEKDEGATLGNSKYLLVEFPMHEYPSYTEDILFNLQLKKYKPIIAHPERYSYYREKPDMLEKLIRKGVYTQLNLPSVSGQYGKEVQKAALDFLKHGFFHLVGTDTHSNGRRTPNVGEALETMEGIVGKEALFEMTKARPQMILDNDDFEVEMPLEIVKKKWFQFFK